MPDPADDFTPTDRDATQREDGYTGWDEHGPIFVAPEPEVVSRLLMAADGAPWWPRASRVQPAPIDGGSILDGYAPKGLWHTTETSGWPSYSTNSFPHMTVGLVDGRFVARQHIPFTRAARALRNEAGGPQTNRSGVKQVEIITRADTVDTQGLPAALEDGLADWATWLKAEWGIPLVCTVTFKAYNGGRDPSSYGRNNGVRLGPSAWERYAGWLGHQHAPENEHGDPGALDWRRILRAEEDDLPYSEDELRSIISSEVARVLRIAVGPDDASVPAGAYFERLERKVDAGNTRLVAIEDDVDILVERTGPPA